MWAGDESRRRVLSQRAGSWRRVVQDRPGGVYQCQAPNTTTQPRRHRRGQRRHLIGDLRTDWKEESLGITAIHDFTSIPDTQVDPLWSRKKSHAQFWTYHIYHALQLLGPQNAPGRTQISAFSPVEVVLSASLSMSSVVLPSRGQCIHITDDSQHCQCLWFFPPASPLLDQVGSRPHASSRAHVLPEHLWSLWTRCSRACRLCFDRRQSLSRESMCGICPEGVLLSTPRTDISNSR